MSRSKALEGATMMTARMPLACLLIQVMQSRQGDGTEESKAAEENSSTKDRLDSPNEETRKDVDAIDEAPAGDATDTGTPPATNSNVEVERDLDLRKVSPVDITVKNLSLEIDLKPTGLDLITSIWQKNKATQDNRFKRILDNVNAYMPQSSITAIIGSSGSGKTSFLNLLAERVQDNKLQASGDITYNGRQQLSSVRSAYVMQQDILLPTLTVRETLKYAAELRLPPPTTSTEREAIVEQVISELRLRDCANTRIGDNEHKGCSGGEKRRTSLGVQLLANPSVLFLDEVTTGLDATSAFQLMRTLKQLAKSGRTIITTIHQPRSEIWGLFDHIVLLSGGTPVYSGPADSCIEHFEKFGHPLPPFVNPAEHLIDIAAVDNRTPEFEEASRARVDQLKSVWRNQSVPTNTEKAKDLPAPDSSQRHAGFVRQLRVQTLRTLKTTLRDPMGVSGSLIAAILMGVLTGWIFLNLDGSLSGIRSRQGAVYTAAALQGYLILLYETYRLTLDIGVFDRERAEGVVGVWSFLLSRRFARFPIEDLPVPFVFSIIFYFMAGFRNNAEQFLIFFAIVLLSHYISVTLAMLAVACSRQFATAALIGNLNFTFQSMCSGMFVQSNQIPVWVRWIKYIAYVWYANGALVTNEFLGNSDSPTGFLYDCPYPGGADNPACAQYTGVFIVKSLGYPLDRWILRPILVLTSFVVAFYICSGLVLTFWKVDMRISRVQTSSVDKSTGKEQLKSQSISETRTLPVTLSKLALSIDQRSLLNRHKRTVSVVEPLSTTFEPGILNVILGVSGGGKTSLLNLMANRLHSSLTTRYRPSGSILFGNAIPSPSTLRSVTSYVSQSDDALLPTLTVRETLHFAAQLRLPTFVSSTEKHARAESVLLKLGLKDCADTLVGDANVKGISGGEKRRVSIGVQILTDPRVILLDEPTSGLDAFTAASILEVLRGLAGEGRTVILTIHQARSDLFQYFGHILLLARGGKCVYVGPGKNMLSHFESLGHPCPDNVNPADFALDLIAVDTLSAQKEWQSSEKTDALVQAWSDIATVQQTEEAKVEKTTRVEQTAELGSFGRAPTPFWLATPILFRRSAIAFKRDPDAILARTMQILGFGIIVTLFFAPLQDDFPAVQTRIGFVQELVALYFVGMLQNVAVYPALKTLFYSENDDGAYGVEAFFASYTAGELPFEIISCLAFSCLFSLAAGLPRTATVFFVTTFNAFALVSCGESVGIIFNTLFVSTGFAVNLTSVVLSLGLLLSGILSTDVAPFLDAFNHLSPGKWCVGNYAYYTLQGLKFTCDDSERDENGRCPIETGEQVLELYNLTGNAELKLLYLAVLVVGYRLVAYLVLKVARSRRNVSWMARK